MSHFLFCLDRTVSPLALVYTLTRNVHIWVCTHNLHMSSYYSHRPQHKYFCMEFKHNLDTGDLYFSGNWELLKGLVFVSGARIQYSKDATLNDIEILLWSSRSAVEETLFLVQTLDICNKSFHL